MLKQFVVNVSNISNEGTDQEIKQFLQLVGPIKDISIDRKDRKVMARVEYYDNETALMAVNHLGGTSFKARDLKINAINLDDRRQRMDEDEQIFQDMLNLNLSEKAKFAKLVSDFAKEEGDGFVKFLIKHKRITEGLMNIAKY